MALLSLSVVASLLGAYSCSRAPRGDRPEAARPARALAAASDTSAARRRRRRLEQVWKL